MLTRFDVYNFGAFLHDCWCCKQEKLKTGEVLRTVSRTSPIRLNTAYSFGYRERKRIFGNIYFSKWQPSCSIKEHRSPELKNTIQP
jgi:hypothetical protein